MRIDIGYTTPRRWHMRKQHRYKICTHIQYTTYDGTHEKDVKCERGHASKKKK